MHVVEELKKKREELGVRIDALCGEIALLGQQRAAFDIVLKVYDESYGLTALSGSVRESLRRYLQPR